MGLFDGFLNGNSGPLGGLLQAMSMLPRQQVDAVASAPFGIPEFGNVYQQQPMQAAMPATAAPMAQSPAPVAPSAPATPAPEGGGLFGNHLSAGLQNFFGNLHNGPIGAIAGGIGGLTTGVQNHPGAYREQIAQALAAKGIDPNFARVIARDQQLLHAVVPQMLRPQSRPLTAAEVQRFGLPAGPWIMDGTTGKPSLPDGLAQTMPAEIKDASGNPYAWNKATNTATPIGGMAPAAPKFDDIASVRKEVGALPEVKRYSEAIVPFRSMVQSATRNTAAADLDFVYGIAKIFDPDSVVREGEMKLVGQAQSLPEEIKGYIKRVAMGEGRLTSEARDRILQVAQTRINEIRSAYDTRVNPYRAIADRHRINVDDILPVLPNVPEWRMPEASAVLPPPALQPSGTLRFNPATRQMEPVR
jgi:hypothetical protein